MSGQGKKIDRGKDTHSLETVEGGTCQDVERNRPSEGHSPSGDGRGRELSGHGNKAQTKEARSTHCLETAEGSTSQDMERNRPSEGHSLSGDEREGLVRIRKEADQAMCTHSLEAVEGLVRTWKET